MKKLATKITPIERLFDGPGKKIIGYLLKNDQSTVKEIAAKTRIQQPHVSDMLKWMQKFGFISSKREGKYTYKTIKKAEMSTILKKYKLIKKIIDEIYKK